MTTALAIAPAILAIDLGKYKSVACEYLAATGEVAFRIVDSVRDPQTRHEAQRTNHPGTARNEIRELQAVGATTAEGMNIRRAGSRCHLTWES